MNEYSIEEFIKDIESLPIDKEVEIGTQGYNRYSTQKAHWLGWLSKKPGAKYYRQDAPDRGPKYVYNHIMEPKMLLYLISALDFDDDLKQLAKIEAKNAKTMASSCAAIRKVIPWIKIEEKLRKKKDINELIVHELLPKIKQLKKRMATRTKLANLKDAKRDIFKQLSAPSVKGIIKDIRILSELADTDICEYTDEDIDTIFNIISLELKIAKSKFSPPKDKPNIRY